MKPILYIGNRNYSSWSLRPWLALKWAGIDFETQLIPLGGEGYGERRIPDVLAVSAAGTVPALVFGETSVGDSLAIAEWAAEQNPKLWPADSTLRAVARAVSCEMHSGFAALRGMLPCNIRRRAEPRSWDASVQRDVARVEQIWGERRGRYLFGDEPSIADAFFTPVATRFRTYAVALSNEAQAYAEQLLSNPAFREWEELALAEPWTIGQTDDI